MLQLGVESASFKYEWMAYGGYVDFESAVNDVKDYVMYYNHIRPHSYNQGLPPILAEKTYRGLLNELITTGASMKINPPKLFTFIFAIKLFQCRIKLCCNLWMYRRKNR